MIVFGPWSLTLALASIHGLVVAGLLLRTTRNRLANRCLAALLVLCVLQITPYTIGYAGFYDAWPWLTYAPFFWQLGCGPLIWLYARQLGDAALPARWGVHFVPLALQVVYYLALFVQPLEAKWAWNDAIHTPWILPLQNIAIVVSMLAYLVAAWRSYRAYQRRLDATSGAREEFRLGWLRAYLAATAATVAIAIGFGLVDLFVRRLSYFDEFPLYVVFALLVYALGVGGLRHAEDRYPVAGDLSPASGDDAARDKDWRALGETYRLQFAREGWWREPDIDLATTARRLGTNTNYLSRALNEGLGESFSDFVNRQRVAAAQARLLLPGDVLAIGLDVGFGSKASFNRVFKALTGLTPSAWRRANGASDPRPIS
ncbi:helix-turn-helix domain-containing protein [Dokdonella sp.]|uniref:AraC family transcriptional regulator n=1 Tax=Dokdonella sp. TaxID=2291710 RepID=UPI0037843654